LLALPGRSLLPIEVTAGRDLRKRLSNLERCMARVGAPRGLLLGGGPTVHDEMGTNGSISFWNLPEFLWILGACERAQAHGRQRE
ncbi:MAG: hypothetical protein HYU64_10350, partial [Armatimonadetes bacterium]|nr:hypothetical protein [Armatimonadota bacterium]